MIHAPRLLASAAIIALVAVALSPVIDRRLARTEGRRAVDSTLRAVQHAKLGKQHLLPLDCAALNGRALLRLTPRAGTLASWSNIGGCGAGGGGASSTAGGAKWVGRGVSGGLLDIQCMASHTAAKGPGYFSTVNARFASEELLERWVFGVNVPVVHKYQNIGSEGADKTVSIAGFGDLSFEIARKLGLANNSSASLLFSVPTGSHETIRQGVFLPFQLQLGSGVLSVTALFEHFIDMDRAMMIVGGSFTYSGWENSRGGFRAPSLSAYTYLGYRWGPFVPSVGFTLASKIGQDREGSEDGTSTRLDDLPIGQAIGNAAIEWSSDLIAVLLSASAPFTAEGPQSLTISLGVQTSLF